MLETVEDIISKDAALIKLIRELQDMKPKSKSVKGAIQSLEKAREHLWIIWREYWSYTRIRKGV